MKASNWYSLCKLIGTILGNTDLIILGFDVEIEIGSLDGSFDGENNYKLEVFCLEIKLDLLMVK